VTGVVFEPFAAVQPELAVVERAATSDSYARVDFHAECEAAINEQIKWVGGGWGRSAVASTCVAASAGGAAADRHPPSPCPAPAASSTM
jgi:hypothetical protein